MNPVPLLLALAILVLGPVAFQLMHGQPGGAPMAEPAAESAAMPTAAAPASGDAASGEASSAGGPVVAIVNGEEIRLDYLENVRQTLPERLRGLPISLLFDQLLDQAITERVIGQAGRGENLQDDPDVQSRVAFMEERFIRTAWIENHLGQAADNVDAAALEARYAAFLEDFEAEQEVSARHILLEDRAAAEEIIVELDGGADFASLAGEHSIGPSASGGGDLGWFVQGDMVPDFATAAFAMEAGEYTAEPVETRFGWHVILVEGRRDRAAPTIDDLRPGFLEDLAREAVSGEIGVLHEAATIERFNQDGTPRPDEPEAGEAGATGATGEDGEASEE